MCRMVIACLVATVGLAVQPTSTSPVPVASTETPNADSNATQTSAAKTALTEQLVSENQDAELSHKDKSQDKARACTLEAFDIILTNSDATLGDGCRKILQKMSDNASKKKNDRLLDEDADLREELKELAEKEDKYERMNDEIVEAQQLLGERDYVGEEQLSETGRIRKEQSGPDGTESRSILHGNGDRSYETSDEAFQNLRSYRYGSSGERENSMVDGRENFIDGRFVVDDNGVGVLSEYNSKDTGVDDDYLVIPIRFLRKQLMVEDESKRARKQSSMGKSDAQWLEDADAARWLLQAILDMDAGDKATPDHQDYGELMNAGKTNEEENQNAEKEKGKSSDHKEDGQSSSSNAAEKQQSLDEINLENTSNTQAQAMENHSQLKQLNRDVLARVEDDISKLGEDLRKLQLKKEK